MHVLFVERHGLEDTETPVDLMQSPADLVVLSFSDSDLGAFAEGWRRGYAKNSAGFPTLRLANLSALKHPVSVDIYIEKTLMGAKGILIRLIGGASYWSYGLAQIEALAAKHHIALAVLPADGRTDPQLDAASTLPISTLRRLQHLCDTGGVVAAHAALAQLALAAGLYAGPVAGVKTIGPVGAWTPTHQTCCPIIARGISTSDKPQKPLALISFYRSFITAVDLAPIEALFSALQARGFDVMSLFAPSLKAPNAAAWLARQISFYKPSVIVNATSFSGKGKDTASPLDVGNVPVFQVALSTADRAAWAASTRGLSPADMAMHVVLPEVDGRLFSGVASFKAAGEADPALEFARVVHQPESERITAIANKIARWQKLQTIPLAHQKPALILSTYPGRPWQMAHAVGLDALASAEAMLQDLGHVSRPLAVPLEVSLAKDSIGWSVAEYRRALVKLPDILQEQLIEIWGDAGDDPLVQGGIFQFPAIQHGKALIALQPERGQIASREADYHDVSRVPCHSYVAFYLWLQHGFCADALVHIGAHGTLEWLPGKAVALCDSCWPEALVGDLPVIYPFIVNDPGEAAQAKRRIGALTLGHIPPPLRISEAPMQFSHLESLLDEFSNADGLDPKRRERLMVDIRSEADALGIGADLGLAEELSPAEALNRIDRFVCDIKESQFGDGLHIFGRPALNQTAFETHASVLSEKRALVDALSGKRIAAGPSGSPYRGRQDVLPSGRNLYTTDPLSVPSRAAYTQGIKLAEEFVRRHLQDHGNWPAGVIVDLWGSATMRTAGEEFAMALHLLGVKPVWADGSERVSGFEILPIAMLDRPRIDVTLRVSGLFRDVFPNLSGLYQQAVDALTLRDETADWNPYIGKKIADQHEAQQANARVFGPAPGSYGLGMGSAAEQFSDAGRTAAAKAWMEASSWALNGAEASENRSGLHARIAKADSFVHLQDMPETDLLISADYAAHEAGFAAAKKMVGGNAALYHLDNTDPDAPRSRTLTEEIARVVHARAANPNWLAGMQRHGFRGAAEISATLSHMAAFANLAGVVGSHLFDAYHEATLGNDEIVAFMEAANPAALAAMRDCFYQLHDTGLWITRRNSIKASLGKSSLGDVA